MRAWLIDSFGGPEVFELAELPLPEPGPGEVRVRVAATSVNPVDMKIRSGAAEALCPARPARLHGDVSGVVDAVGPGVRRFSEGDRVYGCVGGVGSVQGALADAVLADADLLAIAPDSIALQDAAALPLVTLTAWEGWDKVGDLSGKHVLVFGGTGGVGHVAVQLAKIRGAGVTATAGSDEKASLAKAVGADQTVDYTAESAAQYSDRLTQGNGFDAVFDTVGGANIAEAITATKLNGQLVCIQGRGEIDGGSLHAKGVSFHLVFMLIPLLHGVDRARHGRILKEAAKLVDTGLLRPMIDERRFTMDQIGEAHGYAASGEQIGKVLVINPSFAK